MSKCSVITGILAVSCLFLFAAPQTDLQTKGLKGKVKSVKEEYSLEKYNQQGYLESITLAYMDTVTGEKNFTYDSGNRLLTEIEKNENREEIKRVTNTYNAAGLLIKSVRKGKDGNDYDTIEYNAKKQRSRLKNYYNDDILYETVEYIYDAAGNKIKENIYNDQNELKAFKNFVYDKANKLVERSEWTTPATKKPNNLYKFNALGLVTEETAFWNDEVETRTTLYYDQNGNVDKEVIYSGEADYTDNYIYTYTYDKMGNWLTKEWYSEGELLEKIERVITYY